MTKRKEKYLHFTIGTHAFKLWNHPKVCRTERKHRRLRFHEVLEAWKTSVRLRFSAGVRSEFLRTGSISAWFSCRLLHLEGRKPSSLLQWPSLSSRPKFCLDWGPAEQPTCPLHRGYFSLWQNYTQCHWVLLSLKNHSPPTFRLPATSPSPAESIHHGRHLPAAIGSSWLKKNTDVRKITEIYCNSSFMLSWIQIRTLSVKQLWQQLQLYFKVFILLKM